MTHGNASIAESDYDSAGRLTAVRNLKSDRSVISIFTYTYDNAGNRIAVAEANGDLVTWTCDELHRLTREERSGANAYDVTYTYDPVGNRLTKVEGGATTTYSYDAANQLNTEVAPSARTTYTYDANGNTAVINADGSLTTSTWDIENMLTQVALPDGTSASFTYDGDNRRRSKGEGGSVTRFVRDGERVLLETDAGGTMQAQYTTQGGGWFDGLISMRRDNASSFYHFDALGSADRLTDVNQAATDSYLQKAFGVPVASSGSTINPFRFVACYGYYRDLSTGLLQPGVRYYRDATGRFVSRDRLCYPTGAAGRRAPALRRRNCYLYAGDNPVGAVDPSGLECPGGEDCKPCTEYGGVHRAHRQPWRRERTNCSCGQIAGRISDLSTTLLDISGYCAGGGSGNACSGHSAITLCCTTCRRGRVVCVSKTCYCPDYNYFSGCEAYCLERHEFLHRVECRSLQWAAVSCENSEIRAFREERRCLCAIWSQKGCTGSDAPTDYVCKWG